MVVSGRDASRRASSSAMQLPEEIIAMILRYLLDPHSDGSLRTLALQRTKYPGKRGSQLAQLARVSPTWRAEVERILYGQLTLIGPKQVVLCFRTIAYGRRGVGKYVKRLRIWLEQYDSSVSTISRHGFPTMATRRPAESAGDDGRLLASFARTVTRAFACLPQLHTYELVMGLHGRGYPHFPPQLTFPTLLNRFAEPFLPVGKTNAPFKLKSFQFTGLSLNRYVVAFLRDQKGLGTVHAPVLETNYSLRALPPTPLSPSFTSTTQDGNGIAAILPSLRSISGTDNFLKRMVVDRPVLSVYCVNELDLQQFLVLIDRCAGIRPPEPAPVLDSAADVATVNNGPPNLVVQTSEGTHHGDALAIPSSTPDVGPVTKPKSKPKPRPPLKQLLLAGVKGLQTRDMVNLIAEKMPLLEILVLCEGAGVGGPFATGFSAFDGLGLGGRGPAIYQAYEDEAFLETLSKFAKLREFTVLGRKFPRHFGAHWIDGPGAAGPGAGGGGPGGPGFFLPPWPTAALPGVVPMPLPAPAAGVNPATLAGAPPLVAGVPPPTAVTDQTPTSAASNTGMEIDPIPPASLASNAENNALNASGSGGGTVLTSIDTSDANNNLASTSLPHLTPATATDATGHSNPSIPSTSATTNGDDAPNPLENNAPASPIPAPAILNPAANLLAAWNGLEAGIHQMTTILNGILGPPPTADNPNPNPLNDNTNPANPPLIPNPPQAIPAPAPTATPVLNQLMAQLTNQQQDLMTPPLGPVNPPPLPIPPPGPAAALMQQQFEAELGFDFQEPPIAAWTPPALPPISFPGDLDPDMIWDEHVSFNDLEEAQNIALQNEWMMEGDDLPFGPLDLFPPGVVPAGAGAPGGGAGGIPGAPFLPVPPIPGLPVPIATEQIPPLLPLNGPLGGGNANAGPGPPVPPGPAAAVAGVGGAGFGAAPGLGGLAGLMGGWITQLSNAVGALAPALGGPNLPNNGAVGANPPAAGAGAAQGGVAIQHPAQWFAPQGPQGLPPPQLQPQGGQAQGLALPGQPGIPPNPWGIGGVTVTFQTISMPIGLNPANPFGGELPPPVATPLPPPQPVAPVTSNGQAGENDAAMDDDSPLETLVSPSPTSIIDVPSSSPTPPPQAMNTAAPPPNDSPTAGPGTANAIPNPAPAVAPPNLPPGPPGLAAAPQPIPLPPNLPPNALVFAVGPGGQLVPMANQPPLPPWLGQGIMNGLNAALGGIGGPNPVPGMPAAGLPGPLGGAPITTAHTYHGHVGRFGDIKRRQDQFQRGQAREQESVLKKWSAYCPTLQKVTFRMDREHSAIWTRKPGEAKWKATYIPKTVPAATKNTGTKVKATVKGADTKGKGKQKAKQDGGSTADTTMKLSDDDELPPLEPTSIFFSANTSASTSTSVSATATPTLNATMPSSSTLGSPTSQDL